MSEFNFDEILKKIEDNIPDQYRKDAEFRLALAMSQFGDLAHYLTHDQLLNPPARAIGSKKDEEAAFGHVMFQLLMYAQMRDINVKDGISSALENVLGSDWKKQKRKQDKDYVVGDIAHPGEVSGVAHVDHDGKNLHELNNHILVIDHARPDIILHVSRMKGIVTNHGGKHSHAAIIAREHNIPCVVATERATEMIRSGQEIKLDAKNSEEGRVFLKAKDE